MADVARVRHDVRERQRHGDAATHDGNAEDRLDRQRRGATDIRLSAARRGGRVAHRHVRVPAMTGGKLLHDRAERQHDAKRENTVPEEGLAPPDRIVEVAEDWRPHHAGQALSAGDDADGGPAPRVEPADDVGHQRRKQGALTQKAHHDAVDGIELPGAGNLARQRCAHPDHDRADQRRPPHAGTVEPMSHHDAADAGADELQRVGRGRHGARPAEFLGDGLERDDQQIQPARSDQHEAHGRPQHQVSVVAHQRFGQRSCHEPVLMRRAFARQDRGAAGPRPDRGRSDSLNCDPPTG